MSKAIFLRFILSFAFVLLFAHSVSANEPLIKDADFDQLCNVYKDTLQAASDLNSRETELAKSIQNKLPNLFDKLYVFIMRTSADKRYELITQYAKQQNNIEWACKEARLYYANEFIKP